MPTGRVKFLSLSAGYGFIVSDEAGPDVYISRGEVETAKLRGLRALDRVNFELGTHPETKRPMALNIRFLDEPKAAAT